MREATFGQCVEDGPRVFLSTWLAINARILSIAWKRETRRTRGEGGAEAAAASE